MANLLNFRMGQLEGLKSVTTINPGTIYVTTDEQAMYVDIPGANGAVDGKRIRLGDLKVHKDMDALSQTVGEWSAGCLHYVEDGNALAYYNKEEQKWVLINDYSDLREAISTLSETVATNKSDLEDLIGALDDRVVVVEGLVAGFGDGETVKSYVDGIESSLSDAISAVDGKADANAGDIKTLQDEVQAIEEILGDGGTGSIIDTIDGRIDGKLDDLTGTVTSSGHDIQVAVTQLNGKVTGVSVSGDFDETYLKITDHNSAIQTVNGRISEAEQDIADLDAAYKKADKDLDDKITAHVNAVPGLIATAKTEAINEAKGHTNAEIATLDGKITGQGQQIQQLGEDISDLKTADEDLDGRIKVLEGAVDVAKVSTEINKKATELEGTLKAYTNNQITELVSNGQVKTNTDAIRTINEEIAALEQADIDHAKEYDTLNKKVDVDKVSTAISNAISASESTLNGNITTAINSFDTNTVQPIAGRVTNLETDLSDLGDALGTLPTDKTLKEYIDDKDAADQAYTDAEIAKIDAAYKAADVVVEGKVTALEASVKATTDGLSEAIAGEITRATKAEGDLDARLVKAENKLSDVAEGKKVGQLITDAQTNAEANALSAAQELVNGLQASVKTTTDKLAEDLATEVSERKAADTALSNRVKANEDKLAGLTATTVEARVVAAETYAKGQADAALASAKTYADNKAKTNKELIDENAEDIVSLGNDLTALSKQVNEDILNDTEADGILLDSFADVRTFVADRIAANDAMKFMGTIGSNSTDQVSVLPTDAQGGHTYKVATDGMKIGSETCSIGDLWIALHDNPASAADWAYVPSGGEDNTDPTLSSAGNVISLTSDAGVALGDVTIVGATNGVNNEAENTQLVRVSGEANKIVISLEWGTF